MVRSRAAAPLLLGTLFLLGSPADAQEKPPTDPAAPLQDRIEQSVHFGTGWLKKQSFVSGNWVPEIGGPGYGEPKAKKDYFVFPTGCTSLSLYALLKGGVPRDDPAIIKGFQWLRTTRGGVTRDGDLVTAYRVPNGTYELASLVLAIEARTRPRYPSTAKLPAEDLAWMQELLQALLKRFTVGRPWRYGFWTGKEILNGAGGATDMCATSMAVSALVAGERCTLRQRDEIYADVLSWVLDLQQAEGPTVARKGAVPPVSDQARGWGYLASTGKDADSTPTGSMTASALGTIHACTSVLRSRKSRLLTPDLLARSEKARWDGMAWLDQHWAVDRNPGSEVYHFFHLLALERMADSAGMDTVAGRKWFEEGAAVLLAGQSSSGAWTKNDTPRPFDQLNTCFALLFLSRATPPVAEK